MDDGVSPQSFVSFPATDSGPSSYRPTTSVAQQQPQQQQPQQPPHLRPTYLPFRRISLPAGVAPSLAHRPHSVVSIASFDSLPEDSQVGSSSMGGLAPPSPKKIVDVKPKARPASMDMKLQHQQRAPRRKTPLVESKVVVDFSLRDKGKEAKRRKIVLEFYETERAYVDGLELIYSHFLTPIIESLDTPTPLLDRPALTSVFSNFIDIWNLHRSFYSSLRTLLSPPDTDDPSITPSSSSNPNPPPLSPILLSHFPYLSLYTPFITSFPTSLSALSSLTTPTSLPSPPGPSSSSSKSPAFTYNAPFTTWLKQQQSHPKCAKLGLRDWLLTIVQRCPRYLLLLKDLIGCTEEGDAERERLGAVHTLVSKITLSLNTSLHTHAQTLSLLALQRSTLSLPPSFHFISPGRTLLTRAPLVQLEAGREREREFLLFSDCLIWLAREGGWLGRDGGEGVGGMAREWWKAGGFGRSQTALHECVGGGMESPPRVVVDLAPEPSSPMGQAPSPTGASISPRSPRPPMVRTRSKSEAELPTLRTPLGLPSLAVPVPDSSTSTPLPLPHPTPKRPSLTQSAAPSHIHSSRSIHKPHPPPPAPRRAVRRHASSGAGGVSLLGNGGPAAEERYVFKGKIDIVDMEVVVNPAVCQEEGEERRFEVLSPEGSFVVYTDSESERDAWVSAIRAAKAQLLVALNITHPHSTLTSSASTNHIRRTLQALPFPPEDERLKGSKIREKGKLLRSSASAGSLLTSPSLSSSGKGLEEGGAKVKRENRGKVEHWVPAIWIPDGKAEACMRCGRGFGWKRRRHHCRLCGRCVCAGCSGRVFFISDPNEKKDAAKPARSCDACYETVFPVLESPEESDYFNSDPTPAPPPLVPSTPGLPPGSSSFASLHPNVRGFRPEQDSPKEGEEKGSYNTSTINFLTNFPAWLSMPSLPAAMSSGPQALMALDRESGVGSKIPTSAILDSLEMDPHVSPQKRVRIKAPSRPRSYVQILEDFEDHDAGAGGPGNVRFDLSAPVAEEEDDDDDAESTFTTTTNATTTTTGASSSSSTTPSPRDERREDTARRNKRFSLPAVAVQTSVVEARTRREGSAYVPMGPSSSATSMGGGKDSGYGGQSGMGAGARQKRFSLVLGASSHVRPGYGRVRGEAGGGDGVKAGGGGGSPSVRHDKATLGRGEAAEKLSQLLQRAHSGSPGVGAGR